MKMKKNLLLTVIAMLISICLCACGGVKTNVTVTNNDNATSNVDDKGVGTYERTFDRTVNGNKYTYYVYAASDDQFKPDQTKLDNADIAMTLNITTNDFNITAKPTVPLNKDQAQNIANYLESHKLEWEEVLKVFDEKTQAYLEGKEDSDNSSTSQNNAITDTQTNYDLPDVDQNTIANGQGTIEKAFKKKINGDTYQFYFYAASSDQYAPSDDKYQNAHAALKVNISDGDYRCRCSAIGNIDEAKLTEISNEISKEATSWEDLFPLFEKKVTAIVEAK